MRVLIVEHNVADAELIELAILRACPDGEFERIETRDALFDSMKEFNPDVVVAAHAVPNLEAIEALEIVQRIKPGTPVMVAIDAAAPSARELFNHGATDCFLKDALPRLGPAITAAIELRAPLRALSPRQTELVGLLARGDSPREIAQRLKISVKTAEAHRTQVMRRLGMKNLAGLVRYALSIGLVPMS